MPPPPGEIPLDFYAEQRANAAFQKRVIAEYLQAIVDAKIQIALDEIAAELKSMSREDGTPLCPWLNQRVRSLWMEKKKSLA